MRTDDGKHVRLALADVLLWPRFQPRKVGGSLPLAFMGINARWI
jgi:hypothetical protein